MITSTVRKSACPHGNVERIELETERLADRYVTRVKCSFCSACGRERYDLQPILDMTAATVVRILQEKHGAHPTA